MEKYHSNWTSTRFLEHWILCDVPRDVCKQTWIICVLLDKTDIDRDCQF